MDLNVLTSRFKFILPNFFSLCSLMATTMSLFAIRKGEFVDGGWLILDAALCNAFAMASSQLFHAKSDFGKTFSSCCSFFSYGVAPAFLFYAMVNDEYLSVFPTLKANQSALIQLVTMLYIACAATHLSKRSDTESHQGFVMGDIPLSILTLLIGSMCLVCLEDPAVSGLLTLMPSVMVVSGVLSVSNFKIIKVQAQSYPLMNVLQAFLVLSVCFSVLFRVLPLFVFFIVFTYLALAIFYSLLMVDSTEQS